MTSTLTEKAVVGRRVEFAYFRDQSPYHPGVITAITDDPAPLRIRLDGHRFSLSIRPDYEGLRYLDQVAPVPALPMGRFLPTATDLGGEWEGVPVCELASEDIIAVTDNPVLAEAAVTAYCLDMAMDMEFVDLASLEARWVVFEWQPEGDDVAWVMDPAHEGDDHAIRIYVLPAWGEATS